MDWRVGLGRGRIRFVWQRVGNEQGSVDDVRRRPSTSGDESENVRALRGTPNPMVGGAAESKKSYMLAIVADHVHFVDSVFLSFASLWFLRTHAARR